MSVCENCGKPLEEHYSVYASLSIPAARICPTAQFKAKPEPMKAKPGVRYFHSKDQYSGVGLVSGEIWVVSRMSPNQWFVTDMVSGWEEVHS